MVKSLLRTQVFSPKRRALMCFRLLESKLCLFVFCWALFFGGGWEVSSAEFL